MILADRAVKLMKKNITKVLMIVAVLSACSCVGNSGRSEGSRMTPLVVSYNVVR